MELKNSKRILIKTYPHKSGLWYLSLSLYKFLIKNNYNVKFIPKSKFIKKGSRYTKVYTSPDDDYSSLFYKFEESKSIYSNVFNAINNFNADTLISFETLMINDSWIKDVRKNFNIKLIDIPMLEWVNKKDVYGGKYNVFDEIWALTDITYDYFFKTKNRNIKKVTWDYVDRDIFFDRNIRKNDSFKLYHQASLNSDFSSKNTDKVVLAFDKLCSEHQDVELFISGIIDKKEILDIIKKNNRIHSVNNLTSREKVAEFYSIMHCVVAPSSKEGLGLSLYEAVASGCSLITTNAKPMNSHSTSYLCDVFKFENDSSPMPLAYVSVEEIYNQMKKVYEEKYVEKSNS